MKLLVIILNKTECLEELLEAFTQNNISGATIIDSKGMLQELSEHDDFRFIGSLRSLLQYFSFVHDLEKSLNCHVDVVTTDIEDKLFLQEIL